MSAGAALPAGVRVLPREGEALAARSGHRDISKGLPPEVDKVELQGVRALSQIHFRSIGHAVSILPGSEQLPIDEKAHPVVCIDLEDMLTRLLDLKQSFEGHRKELANPGKSCVEVPAGESPLFRRLQFREIRKPLPLVVRHSGEDLELQFLDRTGGRQVPVRELRPIEHEIRVGEAGQGVESIPFHPNFTKAIA